MIDERDHNPLTPAQRRQIQREHRGKVLGLYVWRNFCRECGVPMKVFTERARYSEDVLCEECGTTCKINGAFAPR